MLDSEVTKTHSLYMKLSGKVKLKRPTSDKSNIIYNDDNSFFTN